MAGTGGRRPNAGRKPGSTSKVLPEVREMVFKGVKPYLDNLSNLLSELEPNDKVKAIIELLPYICSKFAPEPVNEPDSNSTGQQFTISVKPVDYRLSADPLATGSDEDL